MRKNVLNSLFKYLSYFIEGSLQILVVSLRQLGWKIDEISLIAIIDSALLSKYLLTAQ